MAYRVEILSAAVRQIAALEPAERTRIAGGIDNLAEEPRPQGCRKLRGTKNRWRLRVGDYRVLYEISDAGTLVLVVRVAHRREAYE